jgi:hypothetical protein
MFSAVKPLSIISERAAKNKQMWEKIGAGKLLILNYLGRIV